MWKTGTPLLIFTQVCIHISKEKKMDLSCTSTIIHINHRSLTGLALFHRGRYYIQVPNPDPTFRNSHVSLTQTYTHFHGTSVPSQSMSSSLVSRSFPKVSFASLSTCNIFARSTEKSAMKADRNEKDIGFTVGDFAAEHSVLL